MNVTETFVRRLEISGVGHLDPVRVVLEDIGPGKGRINIECFGQSWATYWGGMGKDDIAQFVIGCSPDYIAGKLSSIPSHVFDPEQLIYSLKREIFEERRKRLITKSEARDRYDEIFDIEPIPDTVEGLWFKSELMQDLLGDEWWYRLPEKENPEYTYLIRIIKTVREALRSLQKSCELPADAVESLTKNGTALDAVGRIIKSNPSEV